MVIPSVDESSRQRRSEWPESVAMQRSFRNREPRHPAHDRRSERQIVDAIVAARARNVSWTRIGELLGTSAQAAQHRSGNVVAAS